MNRRALCGGGRGPRRRRRRPAGRAQWLPFLKVRFRLPAEAGWLCVGSRVSRVAGHLSEVRLFVLSGLPVRQVGSGLGEPPAWLQRDGWQSYLILQLGWPLRKSSVRRRSASLVSVRCRVKPPPPCPDFRARRPACSAGGPGGQVSFSDFRLLGVRCCYTAVPQPGTPAQVPVAMLFLSHGPSNS